MFCADESLIERCAKGLYVPADPDNTLWLVAIRGVFVRMLQAKTRGSMGCLTWVVFFARRGISPQWTSGLHQDDGDNVWNHVGNSSDS